MANTITRPVISNKSIGESVLRDVYCIGKDCPDACDWLMFIPKAPVLWSLEAMALLADTIATVKVYSRNNLRIEITHHELLMIVLGLSMILRAVLTLTDGRHISIYSLSPILNYYSGLCAHSGLVFCALGIARHSKQLSEGTLRVLLIYRDLQSLISLILLITGTTFMFHPRTDDYASRARPVRTVLAGVIFVTLAK
ncbi:hypothetical protein BX070DRAFT_228345 [Coemansia spiralis]|nr:hypothetical protein BX070DRAFT_228345 [Coemansia spiralis]